MEGVRDDGTKFVPHVLEIAFGTDRPTYALIDMFYEKKDADEGKTVFAIPYHIAPTDVAVFPLMKKPELVSFAKDVVEDLEKDYIVEYDGSGSIGRRYLRAAMMGTPFAITVDYDSLEKKDVTVRDRDSEKQIRVKVSELREVISKLLDGEMKFEDAGKLVK
jgi:glycyl-tRNA synthetase